MDWLGKEPEKAGQPEDPAHKNTARQRETTGLYMPARSTRKPSERFTRRSLDAKSRASQSERFKIASLKEKMNSKGNETTNESSVFNGYCPGRETLPG